mmetsp:Transcript_11788/g.13418  ORF Transcript_11788/g.13418 Transcript_11788/m.13418 type:complete len:235 (+) Transcript_11788:909-1613(+)
MRCLMEYEFVAAMELPDFVILSILSSLMEDEHTYGGSWNSTLSGPPRLFSFVMCKGNETFFMYISLKSSLHTPCKLFLFGFSALSLSSVSLLSSLVSSESVDPFLLSLVVEASLGDLGSSGVWTIVFVVVVPPLRPSSTLLLSSDSSFFISFNFWARFLLSSLVTLLYTLSRIMYLRFRSSGDIHSCIPNSLKEFSLIASTSALMLGTPSHRSISSPRIASIISTCTFCCSLEQ